MTKIRKKVDFNGCPIFVGIDVHKRKWSVAIGTDPALEMAYREFRKRLIPQKATIKVARKLLSRVRYVLVHRVACEKGIVQ